MGKVVKAAIGVAIAVGIAVLAAPTGGLSIALAGALAISTSVASAIITVGLTVAASLAFRALAGGAPKPTSQAGPPQVFRQSVANSFIVYGQRRVGGLMVFFHGAESGGEHYRYFVIACAGHHCEALVSWMLNDEIVTVDGSNKVTSGPYANAAWLWFQSGNASETANATFVSETGGKWTSAHKGNGVAAIYAKFQMTEDVVQAGMPNITAIIQGKDDIYDPRTDTSGYSSNAALVFYDWMATPREEGGFGAYGDEIPDADWISAQANVCDETVNSESRYTINGVITTGAAPSEIRDVLVVNMGGSYTFSGGKHLARPGYWVPVSESLGENDLAGPLQVSPFLPGDQAATEVQGTYISASDGYQGMPFATQAIEATDVRQLDLDLAFTTSKHQAERIARIMLRRAQAEKTVSCVANIEALKIRALDTIQLDTDRYGLSNYAFQVLNWSISADWNIVLSLREENEDIYDAPTPVSAPSVPAITKPTPLGGPVDGGNVTYDGDLGGSVQEALDELEVRTTYRGALVKKSANQTSANYSTISAVAWDTEDHDTSGFHDNSTNNSRLTVPSGVTRVRLKGQIGIVNSTLAANDYAQITIRKNGSGVLNGVPSAHVFGDDTAPASVFINVSSPVLTVVAGDYFEMFLQTGGDTSITVSATSSWFSIEAVE